MEESIVARVANVQRRDATPVVDRRWIGHLSWRRPGWRIVALSALIAICAIGRATRGAEAPASTPSEPVKVIFDTDMDSDCDDVLALAILHVLADRGEAEILATVVSTKNE